MKRFFIESKNIERDSFVWNMLGSMLMAFQSVIMLMILTRTLGLKEAGIFTIAYANANLFLTIGKYGLRYFQVSDVKGQFSFSEYRMSRILTTIAMIIISIIYVFYTALHNDYSLEKVQIIIWMCLFKAVDAVEDVYNGQCQRKARLDVAAKTMTLRMGVTILFFSIGLIVYQDLLTILIFSTILTIIILFLFTSWSFESFRENSKINWKNVWELTKVGFPLFAGTFLSFYIGNAPKYAIDASLSDELQACYGFIAMPVFVIGLLNGFIFNPMLYRLSVLWNEKKIKQFVLKISIQSVVVVGITGICVLGAYFLGVPVLSWLYNTDLSPYKAELLILLLGGGFLGLSGLLNAVITIMRYQKSLMWGYLIIVLLALIFSDRIVAQYQMLGASVLYTLLMAGVCIIFMIMFIFAVLRERKCLKWKK